MPSARCAYYVGGDLARESWPITPAEINLVLTWRYTMSTTQVSRIYARPYQERVACMRGFVALCLTKSGRVLDAGCVSAEG